MEINSSLKTVLKRLRLSGILSTLPDRLAYAWKASLSAQDFLDRNEDVLFMGPVGVGKTHLAAALGHSACRVAKKVLFRRADTLLREFLQARADHTTARVLRSYVTPDLLIIDDFALRRLDTTQSSDMYELIIERHKRASTIFTSNRTVDEWIVSGHPILSHRGHPS